MVRFCLFQQATASTEHPQKPGSYNKKGIVPEKNLQKTFRDNPNIEILDELMTNKNYLSLSKW